MLPLAAEPKNNNEEVIFKIVARLTDCIGEINNTHMDNAKYIDVIIPIYNLM